MTKLEATSKAREFVLANTGVDAEPDSIKLLEYDGRRRVWRAYYAVEHFYSEQIAAGATIDGGEYIIDIDDTTALVSVFS